MKYLYTTLAIGQEYFDKAKQFSFDLYNKDKNFQRLIVSDINSENIPNTIIVPPLRNSVYSVCSYFNFNLKYQAIKAAQSLDYDYIIYIDADWRIHKNYSSKKIQSFLENDSSIDFYFERPHQIGVSKHDEWGCFWKHKISPYNLMNTNKYDEAHVCNEQFMIFKNNNKLNTFIDSWETKNQFCIDNNIWTFAEGVEIGMSSVDANMKSKYSTFYEINECFEFNDISGNLYVRF